MSKIRGTIVLVILLWVVGALGYKAASAGKLRETLSTQYGPGVVVENLAYQDNYLLSDLRKGEAIFSVPAARADPRNPRGFASRKMALPIETSGRWWPKEVRIGYPKALTVENPPPP
jgi:hypothetical protein